MSVLPTLEKIKTELIPAVFTDTVKIGLYGHELEDSLQLEQLDRLLSNAPAAGLGASITAIINCLADANPVKITQKPSRWEAFSGKSLETKVRYRAAHIDLDQLLRQADVAAQRVRITLKSIDTLRDSFETETLHIGVYVQAGKEYLAEHPGAGIEVGYETARERFARKLASLQALQVSHEQSKEQLKLLKAQLVNVLDRFEETTRVLIPVWRQNMLAMSISKNLTAAQLDAAIQSHDALSKSLASSLDLIS